ncbi:hypothetical protein HK102_003733, partial [Quaeritorhiza haematococci]
MKATTQSKSTATCVTAGRETACQRKRTLLSVRAAVLLLACLFCTPANGMAVGVLASSDKNSNVVDSNHLVRRQEIPMKDSVAAPAPAPPLVTSPSKSNSTTGRSGNDARVVPSRPSPSTTAPAAISKSTDMTFPAFKLNETNSPDNNDPPASRNNFIVVGLLVAGVVTVGIAVAVVPQNVRTNLFRNFGGKRGDAGKEDNSGENPFRGSRQHRRSIVEEMQQHFTATATKDGKTKTKAKESPRVSHEHPPVATASATGTTYPDFNSILARRSSWSSRLSDLYRLEALADSKGAALLEASESSPADDGAAPPSGATDSSAMPALAYTGLFRGERNSEDTGRSPKIDIDNHHQTAHKEQAPNPSTSNKPSPTIPSTPLTKAPPTPTSPSVALPARSSSKHVVGRSVTLPTPRSNKSNPTKSKTKTNVQIAARSTSRNWREGSKTLPLTKNNELEQGEKNDGAGRLRFSPANSDRRPKSLIQLYTRPQSADTVVSMHVSTTLPSPSKQDAEVRATEAMILSAYETHEAESTTKSQMTQEPAEDEESSTETLSSTFSSPKISLGRTGHMRSDS